MCKSKISLIFCGCAVLFFLNSALAQTVAWSVNPANFSNNMSMIAQVKVDGVEENNSSNILAAFVGSEVRGIANPTMLNGKAYYFLTVYSNVAQGETLHFQVLLAGTGAIHQALETVPFVKNSAVGSYPSGFEINISLTNDFPIQLLAVPNDTTLMGVAFKEIALTPYLQTQDSDPVTWSVGTSNNLIGTIGSNNMLQAVPSNPTWTGTDSLLITATEMGTPNAYAASQWVRLTVEENYGLPIFEDFPIQFVQGYVPLPSGNLNDMIGFDGPCLEYSVELNVPTGTTPMPLWSQPGTNSGSMNLVVQPAFGGKQILGSSNKIAAFVNGQLVGTASPQVISGKELYFLTLANLAKGAITFQFYDANNMFLHEKISGLKFTPASSTGNFNAPIKVDFAPILVQIDPDASWTTTVLNDAWTGEQQGIFIAKDCKYGEKADTAEVVFLVKQCVTQVVELTSGSGLCLQADPNAPGVEWFMDGAKVGSGTFHGALGPGTYHYEALTMLGCPDLKSCPVVVFETGTAPPSTGSELPTQPPPNCGQITLTEINVDNEPPTAICQPATVQLDMNGNGTLTPADIDGGSFTTCGPGLLSISQINFDCQDLGGNQITLTVEDVTGKSNSCTTSVSVEDNIGPTVICKDIVKSLKNNGTVNIQPPKVYESGSDNCSSSVDFVSVVPNLFTCGDLGENEVTLTVEDDFGNLGTCTAIVTVIDDTPPKVHCKKYDLFLDSNGQGNLLPSNVFKSYSDNCGQMNFVSVVPNAFDCSTYGTQPVTLTVNDGNGNTDACSTTITIIDAIAPVAVCPASIPDVVLDANGNGNLPANIGDESSTDNCSATETSPAIVLSCADLGTQTVILTADDGHGNTNTAACSFNVVDNLVPVLACQDITVSLGSNGETTVAPSQVYDAANSTDNCGTINLVSVTPSQFNCQQAGPNTVTLTANDGHGNSTSCNATVTANEFITNTSIVPTPESCSGAGDGALTISATAGGGQLKYSIDNGANFSASGVFNNLTPGTYNIVIKVFGITNICEVTSVATIDAGGSSQLWYKDTDGDGYSDGNTITSCTQPTGYVASPNAGTDCDDGNATIYPGAPELCDGLDNDCDGIIPADEVDADGDGYRICDGDCDDTDDAVNPGATEICNGIDDDCDGEVDEGVSGGLTWTGNVTFATQADVDAWSSCYSIIDGSMTIVGSDITDLSNLIGIEEVTGTVSIYYNSMLASLDGLDNLATVGGSLTIFYNFLLSDCCAIHTLINGGVTGAISIFFNAAGCNSTGEINTNCSNPLLSVPTNDVVDAEQLTPEKDSAEKIGQMTIFPNPAKLGVSILIKQTSSTAKLQILDVLGRRVFYQQLGEGVDKVEINLTNQNFSSGIYQIVVTDGENQYTEQFVIQ